jgi:CxxC-x17-CxxC domain-containing protein
MYTEQNITCADCGTQFPFTASEQQFYAEKGFTSAPRRCKSCRAAAKAGRGDTGGSRGGFGTPREMHEAVCSACGITTQVPFKPSGSKPVYCRDCFRR